LREIGRQPLISFLCVLLFVPALPGWQGNPGDLNLQIIVVDSSVEAERLLEQIKHGADFAMAKQRSTDASAAGGGYMGRLDPATLRVELRDALRGVTAGQVTGVVKFSEGYAILRVLPSPGVGGTQTSRPSLSTSARGTVRYALNVGGLNDADAVFAALPKPAGWQQDLPGICAARKQSLALATDQLGKQLASADAELHPYDVLGEHHSLAQLEAYQGHLDKAIEQWNGNEFEGRGTAAVPKFLEALGTAYTSPRWRICISRSG
jgi:hypothetical protein